MLILSHTFPQVLGQQSHICLRPFPLLFLDAVIYLISINYINI